MQKWSHAYCTYTCTFLTCFVPSFMRVTELKNGPLNERDKKWERWFERDRDISNNMTKTGGNLPTFTTMCADSWEYLSHQTEQLPHLFGGSLETAGIWTRHSPSITAEVLSTALPLPVSLTEVTPFTPRYIYLHWHLTHSWPLLTSYYLLMGCILHFWNMCPPTSSNIISHGYSCQEESWFR